MSILIPEDHDSLNGNQKITLPKKSFVLPKNHARYIPQNLIFFDTETSQENINYQKRNGETVNGEKHNFKLGCAEKWTFKENNYGNEYDVRTTTTNIKNFINFLFGNGIKKEKSLYIFCHNLSFDFRILLPHIPKDYLNRIRTFTFDSGKSFVSIKNDGIRSGCFYFVDSHNFFHGSIEQLGKVFGLEKIGKDIDFRTCTITELADRCKQDVVILRTAMLQLMYEFILDKVKMPLTLSSLSFSTYRNFYMNHPIKIYHNDSLRKFERTSYHGGRVEIFDMNNYENVYQLDINGMYAHIMRENLYPIEPICILDGSIDMLEPYTKNGYCLLADCLVETNKNIPLYPYLFNGKLYFPKGRFRTTLTTPEIKLALENEELLDAKNIVVYKAKPIFKEYVEHFSKKKEEAKKNNDQIMHLFYKLFGNSLYGKFGQQIESWDKVPDDLSMLKVSGDVLHNNKLYTIKELFGNYWMKTDKEDGRYTNTIIASHITAYARCYLWKLLQLGNPLYTDTDCIFTRENDLSNYKPFIHKTKLGMLDIELSDILFQPKAPKLYSYVYEGKTYHKRKGIPTKAKEIKLDMFEYDYFMGFHETLNIFGQPIVVTVKKIKRLCNEYDKRHIQKDGSTLPIDIKTLLS